MINVFSVQQTHIRTPTPTQALALAARARRKRVREELEADAAVNLRKAGVLLGDGVTK